MILTNNLCPVPMLRMTGAVPLVPHTLHRVGLGKHQDQFTFTFSRLRLKLSSSRVRSMCADHHIRREEALKVLFKISYPF
jgi:hypothetical protein